MKPAVETITFYSRKNEALSALGSGRHVDTEYEIIGDEVAESGERLIRLKKKDVTEEIRKKKDLVTKVCESVGETSTGMFSKVLADTFLDYDEKSVDRMLKALERGEPVKKAARHCFRLYIGDGRKRRSQLIEIRE